jgi:hypothetical protein
MYDSIRIRLSVGLIVVAVLHAILLGLVLRALHTDAHSTQPTNAWQVPTYQPQSEIGSGTIEKLAEPAQINLQAQGEMKQGGPLFNRTRRILPRVSRPICTPYSTVVSPPIVTTPVSRPTVVPPTAPTSPSTTTPNCTTNCPLEGKAAILPTNDRPLVIVPTNTPTITGPSQPPPKKDYQLALFVGNDAQSKQLIQWFEQDPQLKDLRSNCEFQIYTATNALYRTRFADIVPSEQFPVVLFQDATGGHIHAAGRSMIPETSQELFSDLSQGYELYQQAKQAEKTGAIKARGYSWDESIKPTMSLFNEDCPDNVCPTEPANRWQPGSRVRDNLFNKLPARRDALIWASAQEVATVVLSLIAVVLVGFILIKKGI